MLRRVLPSDPVPFASVEVVPAGTEAPIVLTSAEISVCVALIAKGTSLARALDGIRAQRAFIASLLPGVIR